MDADELMEAFMNFDVMRPFQLPRCAQFVPKPQEKAPTQSFERNLTGKDYSKTDYRDEQNKDLTKNFSSMNLNHSLSNITGATTIRNQPSMNQTSTSVNASRPELESEVVFCKSHFSNLPIYNFRHEIVQRIIENPITIVTGKTGCGKTTQVPQYILDNCKARKVKCNILVSQPRKIAAVTIANRVAEERKTKLGTEVGYQVGLRKEADVDMDTEGRTNILYCTTGVILQRLIHEKSMSRYTHIIIDEIHERDIEIDFLLIILRRMLAKNSPHTKIVLMSATMDVNFFSQYFQIPLGDDKIFYPPSVDLAMTPSNFKIKEYFLDDFNKVMPTSKDLINFEEPGITDELYQLGKMIVLICLRQQIESDKEGSKNAVILVFLPGLHEIECFHAKLIQMFDESSYKKLEINLEISVMHSVLSMEEQRKNFAHSYNPKIILATNIAESGVTIPRVTHVIDFCLTKYQSTAKGAQISSLILDWSSKQNCKQRAGRCGRVCDGNVVRMVPKDFYKKHMKEYPTPEMCRIGLESVILKIKVLDMGSPLQMLALALDPPDQSSIVDAVLHLKELGAMLIHKSDGSFDYNDGELTFLGRIMDGLPVDPAIARFIVIGYLFSVLDEAIIIGAGLNLKSIFMQSFRDKIQSYVQKLNWSHGSGSDCIAILNAYNLSMSQDKLDKQWCERNSLDFKNLDEMKNLVKEITRRLESFHITKLPHGQPTWTEREKIFILKVCIAGAFGPSNFFIPAESNVDTERDAFKSIKNMDLFRTVCFGNMDRKIYGAVYAEQLRDTLKAKGVIDDKTKVQCHFDYMSSQKVFVSFENDHHLIESTSLGESGNVIGKVLPEVYKAVKLRQLEKSVTLHTMDQESTMKYAKSLGLGEIVDGNFATKKNYIKNPGWCVLPTSSMVMIRGYVTHVENGNKFFFRPVKATSDVVDDRYEKIYSEIQKMMEKSAGKIDVRLMKAGDFVVASMSKGLERGTLATQPKSEEVEVYLIDSGYTATVKASKVFKIYDKEVEEKLLEYPPRIFECTLQEVQPSCIKSRDGKWTHEAIQLMRDNVVNHKAKISVYSVVNDVASVELLVKGVSWNQKLIEEGYAEECEESYLSKMNFEHRRMRRIQMDKDPPEKEFMMKEETPKMTKMVPSPTLSMCKNKIKLLGPTSPLECNLNGISRMCQGRVKVEASSVNSVILMDDILNFRSKFYVAADLTVSLVSRQFTARETTAMPNITGLAVLSALIFCPTAELRRDENKTRFVKLLTGLGFDKERGQPLFGERDASLNVDFELTEADIEQINQLRYCMSHLLLTEPFKEFPDLVDKEKEVTLKKIQMLVTEILNKSRPLRAIEHQMDTFNWDVDQDSAVPRTNPHGNKGIFNFIAFPKIFAMTAEEKNNLKMHLMELKKCAAGTVTLHKKVCKLCNFVWITTPELKLHLLSKKHVNQCIELMN